MSLGKIIGHKGAGYITKDIFLSNFYGQKNEICLNCVKFSMPTEFAL